MAFIAGARSSMQSFRFCEGPVPFFSLLRRRRDGDLDTLGAIGPPLAFRSPLSRCRHRDDPSRRDPARPKHFPDHMPVLLVPGHAEALRRQRFARAHALPERIEHRKPHHVGVELGHMLTDGAQFRTARHESRDSPRVRRRRRLLTAPGRHGGTLRPRSGRRPDRPSRARHRHRETPSWAATRRRSARSAAAAPCRPRWLTASIPRACCHRPRPRP